PSHPSRHSRPSRPSRLSRSPPGRLSRPLPRLLQLDHSLLPRLTVDVPLAAEVPQHHLFLVHTLDVLGQDRNLAASARGIDYEVGNGQAAGPTAKRSHDLDAGLH